MIDIDPDLVRQLINSQFAQWAHLDITLAGTQGWDNRTFRLGDTLKLRFPRGPAYSEQAVKEARWLKVLARELPVKIPEVIRLGDPAGQYPMRWTVQDWIAGDVAGQRQANSVAFAEDVAGFLKALQAIDTRDGPVAGAHNFHRGGDLAVYDAEARAAIDALAGEIDAERALAVWEMARASRWEDGPVWVHGDVAAGNLLVQDGRLCAVIDFGCLGVGDPACDLVIAWTLFEGAAREAFRRGVGLDAACWARARGWALWKAAIVAARDGGDGEARRVLGEVLAEG